MKKNIKNKRKLNIITISTIITIMFFIYQYWDFSKNCKVSDFMEGSSIDEFYSLNIKYIPLHNIKECNPKNISAKSDSNLNFEIVLTSDKELLPDKIRAWEKSIDTDLSAEVEDYISDLSEEKYFLLVKTGEEKWIKNSHVNIELFYTRFNLFQFLLDKKNVKIPISISPEASFGYIDDFLNAELANLGGLMPYEDRARIEEYERNCPLENLVFQAETSKFNLISVDCSFDALSKLNVEGESGIVEIYTSDFEQGKQAFRDWLAENGLQESDKLRVEYVHVPK